MDDEELRLIIALKYGIIPDSRNRSGIKYFIDSLPKEIIEEAYTYQRIGGIDANRTVFQVKASVFRIMLQQPGNRQRAMNALTDAIIKYEKKSTE